MSNLLRHRLLPHLALLAALLLALVPTFGRLYQADQAAHASPTLVALCTAGGLTRSVLALPAPQPALGQDQGAPAPADHFDCDYCPLLGGLLSPLPPLPAVALRLCRGSPAVVIASARIDSGHPSGLGSRGPPAASA